MKRAASSRTGSSCVSVIPENGSRPFRRLLLESAACASLPADCLHIKGQLLASVVEGQIIYYVVCENVVREGQLSDISRFGVLLNNGAISEPLSRFWCAHVPELFLLENDSLLVLRGRLGVFVFQLRGLSTCLLLCANSALHWPFHATCTVRYDDPRPAAVTLVPSAVLRGSLARVFVWKATLLGHHDTQSAIAALQRGMLHTRPRL